MRLPDKVYDVLKWVALICLPACAWYVLEIGETAGIVNAEGIAKILNATGTLLGLLIGVSTYNYNKEGETHDE